MKKIIYIILLLVTIISNFIIGFIFFAGEIMYALDHPLVNIDLHLFLYVVFNYIGIIVFNRLLLKRFNITKRNKTIELIIMLPVLVFYLFLFSASLSLTFDMEWLF